LTIASGPSEQENFDALCESAARMTRHCIDVLIWQKCFGSSGIPLDYRNVFQSIWDHHGGIVDEGTLEKPLRQWQGRRTFDLG